MRKLVARRRARVKTAYLVLLACFFGGAYLWSVAKAAPEASGPTTQQVEEGFKFFSPLTDTVKFTPVERWSLLAVLCVAVAGLAYAGMLVGQVRRADRGTKRMQEIASAVREGANAYLGSQFRKIGPLILVLTVVLYLTKLGEPAYAFGRAGAFLVGSLFSWMVGFVGMRLATQGNLRVAAAAR